MEVIKYVPHSKKVVTLSEEIVHFKLSRGGKQCILGLILLPIFYSTKRKFDSLDLFIIELALLW
jgi:hypothetical protein